MVTDKTRLGRDTLALYALPQIPHSLALLPVVNFIPAFYSDDLGLPIGLVGLMLVLSRLTDVFTDPMIGIASDKMRTRIGRRRPLILLGLPIICLAVWYVFVPHEEAGLVWLFCGLFAIYFGFTLIDLPYVSWGAEMSNDYDERSRVAAWRGGFGSVGTLVALSIPLILQLFGEPTTGDMLFWMAVFFVITQPLAFGIMMLKLPEPVPEEITGKRTPLLEGFKIVARNRPFIRLLIATSLAIGGMVIGATLNLIMLTHVVKAPEAFPTIIFVQNIALLLGIPIWSMVAERIGKHRTMAICAIIVAICMAATIFFGEGQEIGFGATIIVLGFALGGVIFLAPALVADVVDKDLLETGEERTATYYAFMGMGTKLAVAVGVLIGTALPSLIGFQPSDPSHAPATLQNLRLIYAFAASPLILISALLLWNYPLTREVQNELRRKIEALRGSANEVPV